LQNLLGFPVKAFVFLLFWGFFKVLESMASST